mgnify:CR=1 FL=1
MNAGAQCGTRSMMRAAIGTNNIDNCSRVCHAPTSFALRRALGYSGATGGFADLDHAGAAIVIGANPTEGHPVVGARIKQAVLRGMRLVTIDPDRGRTDRARAFWRQAGIPDLLIVPYKGAGPALADLVGGQVSSMIDRLSRSSLKEALDPDELNQLSVDFFESSYEHHGTPNSTFKNDHSESDGFVSLEQLA